MDQYVPLKRIPDETAVGVGLVIARWAYQEGLLISVLRKLLSIDQKEARQIFSTAEGRDYVGLIRTLVELRGLKTSVDLGALKSEVQDVREERNVVAHRVWFESKDGTMCVQDTTGHWPKKSEATRKRTPEAMRFEANALLNTID